MGIFYKEVCTEDQCDSLSYPDFYKKHYRRYNRNTKCLKIFYFRSYNITINVFHLFNGVISCCSANARGPNRKRCSYELVFNLGHHHGYAN